MTRSTMYALAGAAALNIPTLFAIAVIPVPELIAAAIALAAIGAALGWLAGWSTAADHRQVFEVLPFRHQQKLHRPA